MSTSVAPIVDSVSAIYRLHFDQSTFLDNEARFHLQSFDGLPRADQALSGGLELLRRSLANADKALTSVEALEPVSKSTEKARQQAQDLHGKTVALQERLDAKEAALQVAQQKLEASEEKALAEAKSTIDEQYAQKRIALLKDFEDVTRGADASPPAKGSAV